MSDPVIESRPQLELHLSSVLDRDFQISLIQKIPGGYSNHTYFLTTNLGDLILRKPPGSTHIKSGHDVGREYIIMNALTGREIPVPETVYFEPDSGIFGTPFYLMKAIDGFVLRTDNAAILKPGKDLFHRLSCNAIDQLVTMHNIQIDTLEIGNLGQPQGYVGRQVEGWIMRYSKAKTEQIDAMDIMASWMKKNMTTDHKAALIHNDYKYDNLLLDRNNLSKINAVLDWEMATIGHPHMDLGTTLAYWVEESDDPALKIFNTTWMSGNMTRKEVVDYYVSRKGEHIPDILFYLVFGFFKIAVIAQQIYYRYSMGQANDPRFGKLIYVVKAAANKGLSYIHRGEI